MQTLTKQLTKNEAVVVSDIQNELLIFDPIAKIAYVINAMGKLIWNGINSPVDTEVIVDVLKASGNALTDNVSMEVSDFISTLEEAGLLIPSNESPKNGSVMKLPEVFEYVTPKIESYTEEFLKEHLKDVSFATFHDDTYSDLSS